MRFISFILLIPLFVFASSTTDITYHAPITPPTLQEIVIARARAHGVDPNLALAIVKAESHFDPMVQSAFKDSTGPNGREDSWGLVQIHLPDHPNITRAEAEDPLFAAEFLATELAKGNCRWEWSTCPLK